MKTEQPFKNGQDKIETDIRDQNQKIAFIQNRIIECVKILER